MKHVAAYMLCVLGGNASPSAADVKKVLAAVDAKVDEDGLNKVISELEGKSIEELIAAGTQKMATVAVAAAPSAGGGGGAAQPAAAAAGGKAAPAAKAKEPEPEEDEDMGFSLFD